MLEVRTTFKRGAPCPLCEGYGGAYKKEKKCRGFTDEFFIFCEKTPSESGSIDVGFALLYKHPLEVSPLSPSEGGLSKEKAYSNSAIPSPSQSKRRIQVDGTPPKGKGAQQKKSANWEKNGKIRAVKGEDRWYAYCETCRSFFCPHASPKLYQPSFPRHQGSSSR